MRTAVIVGSVGVVLVAGTAWAQEPQPSPVFRAEVELVAIDVSVIDDQGRPVPDLTVADFTVRVNRRERRLVSAEFISLGEARPVPPAFEHFSSNAGVQPGRLIVFVVDRANIRRGEGRPLIDAALQLIDRLNPSDRIALTALPGGPYIDFTSNHPVIKGVLATIVGDAGRLPSQYHVSLSEARAFVQGQQAIWERVVGRECYSTALTTDFNPAEARADPGSASAAAIRSRMRDCEQGVKAEAQMVWGLAMNQAASSMAALRQLLERLALTPGPKTLIYFSEGLVYDRDFSEIRRVASAAAAAQASLYAFRFDAPPFEAADPDPSRTFTEDRQLQRQGVELMVGAMRGRSFEVAAGAGPAVERLARELSGYYLLSFEPDAEDREGSERVIDVQVARAGVDVRSRQRFLVTPMRAARTDEELLAETLRDPLIATELPLRVATFTLPADDREVRVMVAAELDGAEARQALPVGFSVTDVRGRVVGAGFDRIEATTSGGTLRYLANLRVEPGAYTLKMAAIDDRGRRGSVEHSFAARTAAAGQVRIGDLMLAEVPPTPGAAPVPSVDTRMTTDAVIGYVELASVAAPQLERAEVRFEIAETADAEPIEHLMATIQSVDPGRRIAEARLPLQWLPPGSYVARAEVSLGGRPVGRVTRPFRLERPLAAEAGGITDRGAAARAGEFGLEGFRTERVLGADVLGFFLDRLPAATGPATAAAVTTAIAEARAGRFERVEPALGVGDAGDARVPFLRGLSLLAAGDLEVAAREFRTAIRLAPDFFPAAFYLGACYAAGGRDREAAGAWQTALVGDRDATFVYELLGDALLRLGDRQQAVDILEEAIVEWPDAPGLHRRLAVVHGLLGDRGRAFALVERYLEHTPADEGALLLALWLLHEARAAGAPLLTGDADLERFETYRARYDAGPATRRAIVEQWHRRMSRAPLP